MDLQSSSAKFTRFDGDSFRQLLKPHSPRIEALIKLAKHSINYDTVPDLASFHDLPVGFWDVLDLFKSTSAAWEAKKKRSKNGKR